MLKVTVTQSQFGNFVSAVAFFGQLCFYVPNSDNTTTSLLSVSGTPGGQTIVVVVNPPVAIADVTSRFGTAAAVTAIGAE